MSTALSKETSGGALLRRADIVAGVRVPLRRRQAGLAVIANLKCVSHVGGGAADEDMVPTGDRPTRPRQRTSHRANPPVAAGTTVIICGLLPGRLVTAAKRPAVRRLRPGPAHVHLHDPLRPGRPPASVTGTVTSTCRSGAARPAAAQPPRASRFSCTRDRTEANAGHGTGSLQVTVAGRLGGGVVQRQILRPAAAPRRGRSSSRRGIVTGSRPAAHRRRPAPGPARRRSPDPAAMYRAGPRRRRPTARPPGGPR